MSNRHRFQNGFSIIELLLVVAVVALLGFLGWRFMNRQTTSEQTKTDDSSQLNREPEVKNNSDLKDAENYLNNTDIDSSLDTSEIDTALTE